MAGYIEKLRKQRKLEKLAREYQHQPFQSPIPQGVLDYAREVGGRISNPARTLREAIERMKSQPADEMAMDWANPVAGMAGVVAKGGKLSKLAKKTEFELAHEVAQRNAALPIEQGGLGLPANNTAMDRAKAMGFDTPAYHGTDKDFNQFRVGFAEGQGHGIYTASNPLDTNEFSSSASGGNVMPLQVRIRNAVTDKTDPLSDEFPIDGRTEELRRLGFDGAIFNQANNLSGQEIVAFNPNQIRSRFAAFDPFNRDSANILAGGAIGATGLSLADLLNQEQYQ